MLLHLRHMQLVDLQRTDWRPVTLDIGDIGRSISGDAASLRFSLGGAALKPFYETYGRYSAYLAVTLK